MFQYLEMEWKNGTEGLELISILARFNGLHRSDLPSSQDIKQIHWLVQKILRTVYGQFILCSETP